MRALVLVLVIASEIGCSGPSARAPVERHVAAATDLTPKCKGCNSRSSLQPMPGDATALSCVKDKSRFNVYNDSHGWMFNVTYRTEQMEVNGPFETHEQALAAANSDCARH